MDLLFVPCDDSGAPRHQREAVQAIAKRAWAVPVFAFESVVGGLSL
jgi:hypothetical protein